MKFLVDESVEHPVVVFLRSLNHDVSAIAEDFVGLADEGVLAHAYQQERILVTNDKDFGTLVFYRNLPHAGVILFRLPKETGQSKIDRLTILLKRYSQKLSKHFFIVVGLKTVRIRKI